MPAGSFQPPPEGDTSITGSADALTKPFVQGDVPSGTPYLTPRNNLTGPGAVQSLRTWMRAVAANVLRPRRVQPAEIDLVPLRAVTATGNITTSDDRRLVVGNSATAITLTLPALATVTSGWFFEVLNINAGTVTLDPSGSELIAGVLTLDVPQGISVRVIADTVLGWRVTGREAIPRIPGAGAGTFSVVTDASGRVTGVSSLTQANPPGHLSGFVLTNNSGTPNTHIDFSAGFCRAEDNTADINSAAMTKRMNATWTAGTGNGMLDTGASAINTSYHLFAISKATGLDPDYLASTSLTPTMPATYTRRRRIGWIRTDGSGNIRRFVSRETAGGGLEVLWNEAAVVQDVNDGATGTSAKTATLTVPTGYVVSARVLLHQTDVTGRMRITALNTPDFASNAAEPGEFGESSGGTAVNMSGWLQVNTNTSGQIRYRAEGNGAFKLNTLGWTDERRP